MRKFKRVSKKGLKKSINFWARFTEHAKKLKNSKNIKCL
jgi:hypothetical protein